MRKLLIVDDSPNLRRLLRRLVEAAELGFSEVLEAGDGRQALARLADDPSIGFVLTDGHMPGVDGVELVRAVRGGSVGRPDLPIVVIATEGGERLAARALEEGADACLRKPFSAEALRALMNEVYGRAA